MKIGNMNKKIRIILANNPTASLFMASWFIQNNYDKDCSWKNVAIYSAIDLNESYTENLEIKKKAFEQINFNVLKNIVDAWYICAPNEYDTYCFSLARPLFAIRERKKRIKDLERINEVFKQANINPEDVKEVWLCSNCFAFHFNFLCKKAKFISFEHGISDLRCAIKVPRQPLENRALLLRMISLFKRFRNKKFLWSYLRNLILGKYYLLNKWFEPKVVFFKKEFHVGAHISLFGDEINQINGSCSSKTIDSRVVWNVSNLLMKGDDCYSSLANLEGKTAIVLLESAKPFSCEKNILNSFFVDFERYLYEAWFDLFNKKNIKNIVFKCRFFFEEQAHEAFVGFELLSKNFNICFLTDFSPLNYSLEYYLPVIKPAVILGAYSSGLFYAKKIFKEVEIYTYDDWYVEYCKKNYNRFHDDFKWLRPFFESEPLKPLEAYVPKYCPKD
jgi:hypothetical protein